MTIRTDTNSYIRAVEEREKLFGNTHSVFRKTIGKTTLLKAYIDEYIIRHREQHGGTARYSALQNVKNILNLINERESISIEELVLYTENRLKEFYSPPVSRLNSRVAAAFANFKTEFNDADAETAMESFAPVEGKPIPENLNQIASGEALRRVLDCGYDRLFFPTEAL